MNSAYLGNAMDELRKAEKKELFIKLTPVVAKILRKKKQVELWTDKEIYDQTGVPQNRITEIKKYGTGNYVHPLNEKNLVLFLSGGVLTINDLLKGVKLNDKERQWIESLAIFEDKEMIRKINLCKKLGIDVNKLLSRAIEQANKKKIKPGFN